jgi:hypothetical protein
MALALQQGLLYCIIRQGVNSYSNTKETGELGDALNPQVCQEKYILTAPVSLYPMGYFSAHRANFADHCGDDRLKKFSGSNASPTSHQALLVDVDLRCIFRSMYRALVL